MKTFVILFLVYATSLSSASDDLKCKEFKTGKFTLTDKEIDGKYIIERNDTLQVETDLNTGYTSKYKVTWVNDCEYHLNILEGGDEIMNFYRGKTLKIRIVETYKNSYKYEGQVEGLDHLSTQILRRIK